MNHVELELQYVPQADLFQVETGISNVTDIVTTPTDKSLCYFDMHQQNAEPCRTMRQRNKCLLNDVQSPQQTPCT